MGIPTSGSKTTVSVLSEVVAQSCLVQKGVLPGRAFGSVQSVEFSDRMKEIVEEDLLRILLVLRLASEMACTDGREVPIRQ